jgi:hypothetical protein
LRAALFAGNPDEALGVGLVQVHAVLRMAIRVGIT